MADEQINIQVSDNGTILDVTSEFEKLAAAAEAMGGAVENGATTATAAVETLTAASELVTTIINGGAKSATELGSALAQVAERAAALAGAESELGQITRSVAEGFTAETQAAARMAETWGVAQGAAITFASGMGQATSAAARLATAETEAGAAATTMAARVTTAGGAARTLGTTATGVFGAINNLGGAFGKAAVSIGLFVTAQAAIHASDEYTNLINSLTTVTGSAKGAEDEFNKLVTIANASGSSIDSVAKVFTRLRTEIDPNKVSTDQLNQAVQGLTIGLKLSGASAADVSRSMRELGEIASGAGGGFRQFQSILRNTPGLVKELADAGYNLRDAVQDQGDKVGKLNEKLAEHKDKVNGLTGDYQANVTQLQAARDRVSSLEVSVERATQAHARNGAQVRINTENLANLRNSLSEAEQKVAQLTGTLQGNKDAYDRKNASETKSIENALAAARAPRTRRSCSKT